MSWKSLTTESLLTPRCNGIGLVRWFFTWTKIVAASLIYLTTLQGPEQTRFRSRSFPSPRMLDIGTNYTLRFSVYSDAQYLCSLRYHFYSEIQLVSVIGNRRVFVMTFEQLVDVAWKGNGSTDLEHTLVTLLEDSTTKLLPHTSAVLPSNRIALKITWSSLNMGLSPACNNPVVKPFSLWVIPFFSCFRAISVLAMLTFGSSLVLWRVDAPLVSSFSGSGQNASEAYNRP